MTGQTLSRLPLTALVLIAITGCRDEQKIKADQDDQVRTSLENLITVKGGAFQMGDFGPLVEEKLPYNFDRAPSSRYAIRLPYRKILCNLGGV